MPAGRPCPGAAGIGGCQRWLPRGHTPYSCCQGQKTWQADTQCSCRAPCARGRHWAKESVLNNTFSIRFFFFFFKFSFPKLLKFWKNSAFLASKAHFTGHGAVSGDGRSLASSRVAWGGMLCSLLKACLHLETGRTERPVFVSPTERAPGEPASCLHCPRCEFY